jgi:two-component system, response regulator YesN
MSMYKVVIVEDDRIIRRGIRSSIPWEENGFVVAGDAGDGELALEIIEKEQPQVVISDINMPFMNGLEMAKLVKEKSRDTRIIFLTGFEDFKYAQEAIKLKAFDYLLKPVDSEQLLQKALEAASDWENETVREKRILESLPLLQQKFFKKLVKEGEHRIDVEKQLSELGVQIEGPYYAAILVNDKLENEEQDQKLKEIITSVASPYFTEINCVVMNSDTNEIAILIALEQDHDVRKVQLAQDLSRHLSKESTITFGRTYPNRFELGKSYLESKLAMDMRHILGTGSVHSFEDTVASVEQSENQLHELEAKLENQINLGLPEKVKETLDELNLAILGKKKIPLSDLKILALKYSTMLFFEIEKWKKEETMNFNSSDIYKEIIQLQSLGEMMETLQKLIQQWSTAMHKSKEKKHFTHVDQAIKYIQENYQDSSLTLKKVADHIHVSTPYLSNLFKLEKGFNFGDYLLELRMKNAMEILREGEVKTYEVCERVGYSNPQYFSICFKKYTGYTPAEYKKQNR